jgi:hypothetical protein
VFGGFAAPSIIYNNASQLRKTPPFALFLQTVWPDAKHGLDSGDPVLINPNLDDYQIAYPIQASLYEGMSLLYLELGYEYGIFNLDVLYPEYITD